MTARRILDITHTGTHVLVADTLLQHCRYEYTQPSDRPECDTPMRLVRQAHRVAMSRLPSDLKRDGAWEEPNADKWRRLGEPL